MPGEHLGSTLGQSCGMLDTVDASWHHLGTILGASWTPWDHLGSTLGASWKRLGIILDQFWILNRSGMHLGSILGAFLEHFGSILHSSMLNKSFDAILDRFWVPKQV